MKKPLIIILLILIMIMGNTVFAGSDFVKQNVPLSDKQEVLFSLNELGSGSVSNVHDFSYDRVENQLYIFWRSGGDPPNPNTDQLVYSLDSKELVKDPLYRVSEGYSRLRMQFVDGGAWSLEKETKEETKEENEEEKVTLWLTKTTADQSVSRVAIKAIKDFRIHGEQILLQPIGCSDIEGFGKGSVESLSSVISTLEYVKLDVDDGDHDDDEHDDAHASEFAFSPDGKDLIYAIRFNDSAGMRINTVTWEPSETEEDTFIRRDKNFVITIASEKWEGGIFDLYTTEDHIVVLSKMLFLEGDKEVAKAYIERYTYDGELVDRVVTNFGVKRITEGPNGSTIYVQKKYGDMVNQDDCSGGTLEVIQVNWENNSSTSRVGGPKPVIKERTRLGSTIARFTDEHFGLLRMEEPETGFVDYEAPIRSTEKLVKLQIPYCDIKAKCESGARNLLVEYQGQTLYFPMELFDCDDMLAAMPCQTDATVEIIMHTDEAGNVTYEVQFFVVEQRNAMTRVVHRKTIQ